MSRVGRLRVYVSEYILSNRCYNDLISHGGALHFRRNRDPWSVFASLFPDPFAVLGIVLCQLPDVPVGDGLGEVVVVEGVCGLMVHEVECPVRRI